MPSRLLLFVCLFFLPVSEASSKTRKPSLPPSPPQQSSDEDAGIEVERADPNQRSLVTTANQWQREITSNVYTLSNRLDSFFGTARADDEASLSNLRLNQSNYFSETGAQSSDFQVRFNLRLRNVEDFGQRLQESFISLFESDTPEGTGPSGKTAPGTSRARQELVKWNVNWENRVGLTRTLDLNSILRARRNFEGAILIHRFYQELGWSSQDEWQAVTSFSSDKAISSTLLFRFSNELRWAMTYQKVSTAHGPSLLQTIDENNSISYDARFLTSELSGIWYGEGYTVGSNFRRQFKNKWLFLDVSPQISFPRLTGFNRDINITFRLEAALGGR